MKKHKDIILAAAREVFPHILPSRLQEARQALLSHLNMTEEDFGFFPSGGKKFDNLCSQVVKTLKGTGEMRTEGWTWVWNAQPQAQPQAQAQPTTPLINMSVFDLMELDEVQAPPSLYALDDEETIIRLVGVTPCFGKIVNSDPECQGCSLNSLCSEKKLEVKKAKREAKEAKEEALEIASQAGYDLSQVSIPKSARLSEIQEYTLHSTSSCVVTNEALSQGETAYLVPSWGLVKKEVGEALKLLATI